MRWGRAGGGGGAGGGGRRIDEKGDMGKCKGTKGRREVEGDKEKWGGNKRK